MRTVLLASLFTVMGSLFAVSEETPREAVRPFSSFTGRLVKNKVRMRVQPTLDAGVIRELAKGDMLIVTGEIDDFYSVLPPTSSKAYVFRTFVPQNIKDRRILPYFHKKNIS